MTDAGSFPSSTPKMKSNILECGDEYYENPFHEFKLSLTKILNHSSAPVITKTSETSQSKSMIKPPQSSKLSQVDGKSSDLHDKGDDDALTQCSLSSLGTRFTRGSAGSSVTFSQGDPRKTCIITLCKILDNILNESSYNPKTRTIKIENRLFREKVGNVDGGVDFLESCNFVQTTTLSKKQKGKESSARVVQLLGEDEDRSVLIKGRLALHLFGKERLGLSSSLPKIRFEHDYGKFMENLKDSENVKCDVDNFTNQTTQSSSETNPTVTTINHTDSSTHSNSKNDGDSCKKLHGIQELKNISLHGCLNLEDATMKEDRKERGEENEIENTDHTKSRGEESFDDTKSLVTDQNHSSTLTEEINGVTYVNDSASVAMLKQSSLTKEEEGHDSELNYSAGILDSLLKTDYNKNIIHVQESEDSNNESFEGQMSENIEQNNRVNNIENDHDAREENMYVSTKEEDKIILSLVNQTNQIKDTEKHLKNASVSPKTFSGTPSIISINHDNDEECGNDNVSMCTKSKQHVCVSSIASSSSKNKTCANHVRLSDHPKEDEMKCNEEAFLKKNNSIQIDINHMELLKHFKINEEVTISESEKASITFFLELCYSALYSVLPPYRNIGHQRINGKKEIKEHQMFECVSKEIIYLFLNIFLEGIDDKQSKLKGYKNDFKALSKRYVKNNPKENNLLHDFLPSEGVSECEFVYQSFYYLKYFEGSMEENTVNFLIKESREFTIRSSEAIFWHRLISDKLHKHLLTIGKECDKNKIISTNEFSNARERVIVNYALKFLPFHYISSGKLKEATHLLLDISFVQLRNDNLGIFFSTSLSMQDCSFLRDYVNTANKLKPSTTTEQIDDIPYSNWVFDICESMCNQIVSIIHSEKKKAMNEDEPAKSNAFYELGKALHRVGCLLDKMCIHRRQIDILHEAVFFFKHSSKVDTVKKDDEHLTIIETYCLIGGCHRNLQQPHDAIFSFKEALSAISSIEKYNERGIHRFFGTAHVFILFQIGVCHFDCGQFNEVQKLFQEALTIRKSDNYSIHEACETGWQVEEADVLCWMGNTNRELKNFSQALKIFNHALEKKSEEVPIAELDIARIHQNIGIVLHDLKQFEQSLQSFKECLRIRRAHLGDDHKLIGNTLTCMGNVYRDCYDIDRALNFAKIVLKMRKKIFGQKEKTITPNITYQVIQSYEEVLNLNIQKLRDCNFVKSSNNASLHNEIATSLFNLGNMHEKLDHFEEAVRYYNKALKISKLKKEENTIATIFNSLGIAHAKRHSYQKAMICFKNSLALRRSLHGNQHADVAESLHNIGNTAAKLRDYDTAIESYTSALLIKKTQGKHSVNFLNSLHNIGVANEEKGNLTEALNFFKKCYDGRISLLGENHLDVAISLHNIGNIFKKQHKILDAIEAYGKALTIKNKCLGNNNLSVAVTMHQLAQLILLVGESKYVGDYVAKNLLELALVTYERSLGMHVSTADVLHLLGTIGMSESSYDSARRYFERALALKKEILGDLSISVAETLYLIGKVQGNSGDIEDALETLKEAMQIQIYVNGKDHENVAAILNDVGVIQLRRGNEDAALLCFKESIRIWEMRVDKKNNFIGEVLLNVGEVEFAKENYDEAINHFIEAMSIFKEKRGVDHISVALVYYKLGKSYFQRKEFPSAIETFEKCISIRTLKFGSNSLPVAEALGDLGVVYLQKDELMKARDCLSGALQTMLDKSSNNLSAAEVMFHLGKVMIKMKYYDEAITYFQDSITIRYRISGKNDLGIAETLMELGLLHERKQEYHKSLDCYRSCLQIRKAHLSEHEFVADTYHSIGVVEQSIGNHKQALVEFGAALTIYQKCIGEEHSSCAKTINNIGLVYDAMKEYDESIKYHKEALRLRQLNLGKDDLKVADSLDSIASIYQRQAKNEKALKCLKEAMRIRTLHLGNDHLEVATTLFGMGIIFCDMNELDKAMSCYDVSLSIRQQKLGGKSIEVAQTLHNMGSVYALKQEYKKALEHWTSSLEKYKEAGLAEDHHMVTCTRGNISMAESLISGF